MSPQASDVYLAYPHAVQPSHAPPALIPPNHNAAAMNGSGTTQSGLRLIQKQPGVVFGLDAAEEAFRQAGRRGRVPHHASP